MSEFPVLSATPNNARSAMVFLGVDPSVFDKKPKTGNINRLPESRDKRDRLFVFLRIMWNWSYPEIRDCCGMKSHSTIIDSVRRIVKIDGDVDYRAMMIERLECTGFVFPRDGTPAAEVPPIVSRPYKPKKKKPEKPRVPLSHEYAARIMTHGPKCGCKTCEHFVALAAKIVERNPDDVRPRDWDAAIRPFIRSEIAKRQQEAA